jgi:hypothetical protein
MALSEHEQRVLEEIEYALSVDSHRLASSLGAARPHDGWSTRSSPGGQLLVDLSLLLTGLTVLLIGVHANSGVGIAVGLIGYAVTALSVQATLSTLRRKKDAIYP